MIREIALTLTGWIIFSLALGGFWVGLNVVYRWRYRRGLRRRFKRAATSSSAGVANREGTGRRKDAIVGAASLDRPAGLIPPPTQGARSSRGSGREGFPRSAA